ncbi:MAG: hypothetical protein QNJ46_23260 [Leptolyngbyaceae cyanobacterium MO_188.B28]|nr:hypothetical protein [Leptolyngbyaceae cyanobacterium MO_188.B28]
MPNSCVPVSFPKGATLSFSLAGLLALALPMSPAAARNDYNACTGSLIDSGVAAEAAIAACSLALHPRDVSDCVDGVVDATEISASKALTACSRVRRPKDLSACVSDIHGDFAITDSLAVLDNCRHSLLPTRFADCVSGVGAAAALAAGEAMQACISAGFQPRDVAPSFVVY